MHLPTVNGTYLHLDYMELEHEVLISMYGEGMDPLQCGAGIDDPQVIKLMIDRLQEYYMRMIKATGQAPS